MQYAQKVGVVELEALHLGAVRERRVRRREFLPRAPHRAGPRGVQLAEPLSQDAAPLEIGAVNAAAERIEHQQLDAGADFLRNAVVLQAGYEFGNAARIAVIGGRL